MNKSSHAILDETSRHYKYLKIRYILERVYKLDNKRLLEIGTGSGIIAHEFAKNTKVDSVHAVDIIDQRKVFGGYEFSLVNDTTLPFPENYFDIVISNHVIEHVGTPQKQKHHLHEINRVLKKDGIAYLAVPNKWTFIEPHYKLPFLSWLPRTLSNTYIRWSRKGSHYDCNPLSMEECERLFSWANFSYKDMTAAAMDIMLMVEPLSLIEKAFLHLPTAIKYRASRFIPTLIFVLQK